MRQTADILRPWQSMGEPPPPGGEGPKCQDCGWSQWVELGGGDSPDAFHPNLDVRILPGVDIAHDLERLPLPFHDGHAERMKLVHVLNHLTAVAGEALLAECFRILRPGGEIFVMVTDLAFCMDRVLADGPLDCWMTCIYGTRGDTHGADFHKWGYTRESLLRLLSQSGFATIQFVGYYNRWEIKMVAKKP